jgi:GNAT superfamily N-acetyltransferase
MQIRDYIKVTDLSQICHFHATYYYECFGWDEEFEAYVADALSEFVLRKNSREKIWIADTDGQVKGAIALVMADDETAQLRWYYVVLEMRGQGLGKELMARLIQFAKEMNYKKIILWTEASLKEGIEIYRRNGFVKSEELIHHRWGQMIKEEKYIRDITENRG